MEPLSFFSPNADNLFKFLFLNGVVMVAVGLLYPLQKSNELELSILDYDRKIELLKQDVKRLTDDSKSLNTIVVNRIKFAESLAEKKKNTTSKIEIVELNNQINELKQKTNISFQEIKRNEDIVEKNYVNIVGKNAVIKQLKRQVTVYDAYCSWLLRIGIFLGIFGFIGWVLTTFFTEYCNYMDFRERWRKANRISRRKKTMRKAIDQVSVPPTNLTSEDTNNSL